LRLKIKNKFERSISVIADKADCAEAKISDVRLLLGTIHLRLTRLRSATGGAITNREQFRLMWIHHAPEIAPIDAFLPQRRPCQRKKRRLIALPAPAVQASYKLSTQAATRAVSILRGAAFAHVDF
jgi:hypothetical protein